jgi:choline-sulfatase
MPRLIRLLATLLLLVALGRAVVPRSGESVRPPDGVILVLIDALRADRLGCYGYRGRPTSPHIDALAADATRFANAISSTPWTLPSMATLFTSLYPSVHGAVFTSDITRWLTDRSGFRPTSVLDPSRTTLAEVLRAHGFATAGFIQGSYPSPEFGVAQGFDVYEANVHPGIRFNVEAIFDWFDRTRPRRFFVYLHTAEVHSPYMPPGPNRLWTADSPDPKVRAIARGLDEERERYRALDFDPGYRGWLDGSTESLRQVRKRRRQPAPRDVEHLGALYDRGIAYTDVWIGRLVDGLRARGLLDRSIFVFTADHGEELMDHGGVEHLVTHYDELMRVPLIVRVPDAGHGRVVQEEVGLIDVMPTVLDLLGVSTDLPMQGRSLRPLIEGGWLPERPLVGEASNVAGLRALRTNRFKYLRRPDGSESLFDLTADPGEHTDVCPSLPETCAGLARRLRQWEADVAAASHRLGLPPAGAAALGTETRDRLRQLGYAD